MKALGLYNKEETYIMINFQDKVSFIWSIAEVLRGPYKPEDYGKVILPLAVLRRFDCVLDSTKDEVLSNFEKFKAMNEDAREPILNRIAKQNFHNASNYNFTKLLSDADNIADNLRDYINGFSKTARDIMDHFDFDRQIDKLDNNNLLYLTIKRFSELDLHPEVVSNVEMGYIFEELIRRFSEHAEAGDHYTPREVVRLMVSLLFMHDDDMLTKPGLTQTLYDCAAGTGGMGSVAQEYLKELNATADLEFFAQEINDESYAICKADILIKGADAKNIRLGNTLSNDQFKGEKFDYLISNPPYGVDWKSYEKPIKAEHEEQGYNGRFGPGTPRTSDGQLLFLLHLISKMKPVTAENPQGSRLAIIMNGSPLFTGDAGSGESEIRRYVLENDLVEGIVAMPNDLFYNTGISTYIWILTNNKAAIRKGKVQLINAVNFSKKMKKSMGSKRNEIAQEQIDEIVRLYGDFKEGEYVKIFDNEDFGYHKITVERPLRLSFCISEERIQRVVEQKAFQNLATSKKKGDNGLAEIEAGQAMQTKIIEVLRSLESKQLFKNRDEFTKLLKDVFKKEDVTIGAPVLKAILAGLSEKDETADICMKNKTDVDANSDLRDIETIALKENIEEYFEREVKSYYPDAWIDYANIKIEYKINFSNRFYKFNQVDSPKQELNDLIIGFSKYLKQLQEINLPFKEFSDNNNSWLNTSVEKWEFIRAKYLFKEVSVKGFEDETLLSVLKGKGLVPRSQMETGAVMATKDLDKFKLVTERQFVIHLRSFQSGFEMSTLKGIVSPAYTVFELKLDYHPEFFKYLFYSKPFIDYIATTTQSLRDGKPISFKEFGNMYIPVPPLKEQIEIANYLERIDKLITEFEFELNKLKNVRDTIVSNLTTGRLLL